MDVVTNANVITIGRPASNVKAYILDPQGHILPPLVPGELVIAGAGVGRGYVKRDDIDIVIDRSVRDSGSRTEYEPDKFEAIEKLPLVEETKHFVHVRTEDDLLIKADGMSGKAVVGIRES